LRTKIKIKIKIYGNGNGNGESVTVRPGGVPFAGGSDLLYAFAGKPGCLGATFRV
jgi:hypothetical protein